MKLLKLGIPLLLVTITAVWVLKKDPAPHQPIHMRMLSSAMPAEQLYQEVHKAADQDLIVLSSSELSTADIQRIEKRHQNRKIWMSLTPRETTFYAGLFKQVKLEDVFAGKLMIALAELAGSHAKITNRVPLQCGKIRRHPYARASEISKNVKPVKHADLVVFSFDRPLQLYAFLESMEQHIEGLWQVSVVYRCSNRDYEAGYATVKKRFEQVRFLQQGQNPSKDFKPLFLEAAFHSPAPYILFAVDDIIVKNRIDLGACIEKMEQTGAYGFFLRLGKEIDYCDMTNIHQGVPPSWEIEKGIFAWQFKQGKGDWHYPNSVDMSLYKKSDIEEVLRKVDYHNPNLLESRWALKARYNKMGLYYDEAKIVNIPLNMVNQSNLWGNWQIQSLTPKDLLEKLDAGLKIDIRPFSNYAHRSVHVDEEVDFIARNDE